MMKRRRSVLLQRLDAIGPMFSSAADVMQIVRPSESDLPSYITALKRGWSPVPQLPNAAETNLLVCALTPRGSSPEWTT